MLKLWLVKTGECLKTWEFPTAIKRVSWSEDDTKVLALTEQRMGFKGTINVFDIVKDGSPRKLELPRS